MSDWMIELGWALASAILGMFVLWLIQLRTNNAGIVDLGWTFGIGATVAALAVVAEGDAWRRAAVAGISAFWAMRLGGHLAVRIFHEPEDGRYQNLRAWAGPRQQPVMLAFFLLQGTWVVMFALPQFVAMQNDRPLSWIDAAAVALFLISVVGETIADRQLARFRANPGNRGQVCTIGLWRYSRHPNYFFEWLHWFVYPLMCVGVGWVGWLTLLGPALMLYLLLYVTGIPPTEARAVQSRGNRYRAYQRTTSAFFPWFPRSEAM